MSDKTMVHLSAALTMFWCLVLVVVLAFDSGLKWSAHAQSAAVSQSYGLTLERDDFPPAFAGQTVFQTAVSTRSSFALFFRNGLLQRPCPAGVAPPTFPPVGPSPVPCDYSQSGNVIATYGAGMIQENDLVSVLFYR